ELSDQDAVGVHADPEVVPRGEVGDRGVLGEVPPLAIGQGLREVIDLGAPTCLTAGDRLDEAREADEHGPHEEHRDDVEYGGGGVTHRPTAPDWRLRARVW